MMPSEDERPILHATDVKFVECKGRNVLCVEPYIDMRRNFDVTFSHSDNVSTFMSVRYTVNIGPYTNNIDTFIEYLCVIKALFRYLKFSFIISTLISTCT